MSREWKEENTVVELSNGTRIGGDAVVVMAGPCAVESEEQILGIAHALSKMGATVLRGGAFKPRSSPYSFQGLGLDQQPHRTGRLATVQVEKNGSSVGTLQPALNQYEMMREPIGTPDVRSTLTHDLYLTLQSTAGDGSAGLRAIVTPAVLWIWIGVIVIVVGMAMSLYAGSLRPRARSAA